MDGSWNRSQHIRAAIEPSGGALPYETCGEAMGSSSGYASEREAMELSRLC